MELLKSETPKVEEQIEQFDSSIFLNSNREFHKVSLDSILYIEAMGDYVKVVCTEQSLIVYVKMHALEASLPTSGFFRLHRSYIVSLNSIEKITSSHVLIRDKFVPISKQSKKKLLALLPIIK